MLNAEITCRELSSHYSYFNFREQNITNSLIKKRFPLKKKNRISIQVTSVDDLKPSEKNDRVDRPGYQDDIDITREDATICSLRTVLTPFRLKGNKTASQALPQKFFTHWSVSVFFLSFIYSTQSTIY